MKDNDFDDIGKRLHDLEADPPKVGWDKIATTLNSPKQPGKLVWLRKHGWKPLVILIPVSVYLIYSGQRATELSSSVSSAKSITITKDSVHVSSTFEENKEEGNVIEKAIEKSPALSSTSADSDKNKVTPVVSKQTTRVNDNSSTKVNHAENNSLSQVADVKISGSKPVNENNLMSDLENESGAQEQMRTSQNNEDGFAKASDQSRDDISQNISDTAQYQTKEESTVMKDEEEIIVKDSTSNSTVKEEKQKGQWRLTALVSPQYLTKTVKPVTSDEVLVTNIEDSQLERSGFGFALGAGKAITPDFYVDAQLSYVESSQVVNYSYAAGKVDTLIATLQPDQSVLVTPVYQINNREVSTKYGYGGIRLGATYYFWTTPRGRFNLAASTGVHYLLSSQVKERINNQWVSLSNENLNKANYSFMVGVGYNVNLTKGWELMINPALTYYIKEIQDEGLPYKLNKQSFGLNFMLSKTLGLR